MAIHIEVFAHLNDRDVKREADKLGTAFDQAGIRASNQFIDAFSTGLAKGSPKVQKAFSAVENAVEGAERAFRDYMKTMSSSRSTQEQQIRVTENLDRAKRAESDAHRSAAVAIQNETAAYLKQREAIRHSQSAITSINDSIQTLGTNALRTSRGIAAIGAPALFAGLLQTAEVAVTATQSLALLPAVATAAAAGMGTLQLATQGFSDALKEMGDIDKFNEAVSKLAPNAQAVAYQIRSLVPEFKNLQIATQNAAFEGFAEKLDQLATTFLPTVQGLTTDIATSMNKGLIGVSDMLLTPANQANISAVAENIGEAFRMAEPAVRSFAQAFITVTTEGSKLLPGLADSVATVAAEFGNFIDKTADSGQLQEFMQQGIDAAKALGSVLLDVGKAVYDIFGGSSQDEINAWRESVENAIAVIGPAIWAMNEAFKALNTTIGDTGVSIQDLTNPLLGIKDIIDTMRWFFDPDFRAGQSAAQAAVDKLNVERRKKGLPPVELQPDGTTATGAPGAPGGQGGLFGDRYPGLGTRVTDKGPIDIFGNPLYGDKPPKGGAGAKPSDKDRRDAIIAGLDPAMWQVDPFGGMAGMQMGPGANPQDVLEQQRNVIAEAHDLEEANKNLLALQQDDQATQQDIDEAKWRQVEEGWQLQEAQVKLAEKMAGTAKDIKSGSDELSAALDPDLGLGRGLAGLADNLVRFIGNLAAAPMMAKLQTGINANAAATGMKGGYGMLGVMGAQNMAQGLSPLLGQPMPGGAGPASTGGGYQSSYTPTGGQYPSATAASNALPSRPTGGYIGDAALLANVPAGQYTQSARGDLTQGLADCSSAVEDLVNLIQGRPTTGASMYTGNAAQWLTGRGFQQGMGGPGDMRVGFNSGHMQATLPGGTPFNWGGSASAARGGVGGTGAADPSFTSHFFLPVGGGPATVGSGPLGTPLPAAPTSGGWFGGSGGGGGAAPLPFSGGGGESPLLSTYGGPGIGGGMGMNPTLPTGVGDRNASPDQPGTRIGAAVEPPSTPGGGGGLGIEPGGTIDTAIGMAASAADLFAPGAGQAMQTGMKLASRAIQYGGQMAGIGVGGLMETFLPTGGSELANNSWLTKIAGGIASASPQLPNMAGGKGGEQAQGPLTPGQVATAQDPNLAGFQNTTTVNYNSYNQTGDASVRDLEDRLGRVNAAPMFGMGGGR